MHCIPSLGKFPCSEDQTNSDTMHVDIIILYTLDISNVYKEKDL